MGKDALDLGLEAIIQDARASLDWLRARSEAQGSPPFLIGHSQGGTVALVIAADAGVELAGVVLMACMGRGVHEVIADQIVTQGRKTGLGDAEVADQLRDLDAVVALVREDRPWEPGSVPDHLFGAFRSRAWLKEHLAYDPRDLLRRTRCPVLICQGGKDFQVSVTRDAEALVAAARDAGLDCEQAVFPDLDHLFKPTEGESTMAQYFDSSRHVDAELLDRLTRWLLARWRARRP